MRITVDTRFSLGEMVWVDKEQTAGTVERVEYFLTAADHEFIRYKVRLLGSGRHVWVNGNKIQHR